MLKRTDFSEKRHFGRRPTNARGWIKIWGRPPVPCIVADLSFGGAALECEEDVWLPASFHIVCEALHINRYCEVRHNTGRRYGVEFVADAAQATNSLPEEAQWGPPVRTFQISQFRR